jgi:hypothetical protein
MARALPKNGCNDYMQTLGIRISVDGTIKLQTKILAYLCPAKVLWRRGNRPDRSGLVK